jgi:hypothetical protein
MYSCPVLGLASSFLSFKSDMKWLKKKIDNIQIKIAKHSINKANGGRGCNGRLY